MTPQEILILSLGKTPGVIKLLQNNRCHRGSDKKFRNRKLTLLEYESHYFLRNEKIPLVERIKQILVYTTDNFDVKNYCKLSNWQLTDMLPSRAVIMAVK